MMRCQAVVSVCLTFLLGQVLGNRSFWSARPRYIAPKASPQRRTALRPAYLESEKKAKNANSSHDHAMSSTQIRAGAQSREISYSSVEQTVKILVDLFTSTCRIVLPPVVACTQFITGVYRALPKDAILAQTGLVYCFAGGYFPTLFAAVQAAERCGIQIMLSAVSDLCEEAAVAIDAAANAKYAVDSTREMLRRKTLAVLASVDPVKINQATAALYTTWLGVESVLEREFARTITLSLTIADYLDRATRLVIVPPIKVVVAEEYHQWVPVVVGWGCKAAAMSVAWRIQRVITASTSAIAGGLMFSRAMLRIASRRVPWLKRHGSQDIENIHEGTYLDEVVGLMVAALGLYSQIGDGFSFEVPFPLSLVTWPFELAERWIQWQITKDKDD